MRNIILVETNRINREDLQTAYMLYGYEDYYTFTCLENTKLLAQAVQKTNATEVILCAKALKERKSWESGSIRYTYYGNTEAEVKQGASFGLSCYGAFDEMSDLLEAIKDEKTTIPLPADDSEKKKIAGPAKKKVNPLELAEQADAYEADDSESDEYEELHDDETDEVPVQEDMEEENPDSEEDDESYEYEDDDYDEDELSFVDDEDEDEEEISIIDEDEEEEEPEPVMPKPGRKNVVAGSKERVRERNVFVKAPAPKPVKPASRPRPQPQKEIEPQIRVTKKRPVKAVKKAEQETRTVKQKHTRYKGKTKVVTVYSAKGGVGKTTVAIELATYLALVKPKKDHLKVCVLDFNIDFGDVRATLGITNDRKNLTYWAAEVAEQLDSGLSAEEIKYTEDEIAHQMVREKNSGLYVLPAPLTNEDSAGIRTEALNIILDNIIRYGNFDVVVCDTGNNTRDSTMIALYAADIVLMIMTQNVNTANCDRSFAQTMAAVDFDMSKVRLVINDIYPKKATNISVEEIIEYFPYKCVGKIKHNTDVIKAGNMGDPLVFDKNHEFTRSIREILLYVLNIEEFEEQEAPKKSFFGKLMQKKKK